MPIQYADYTLWQRNHLGDTELARQLDYWQQQLAGIPAVLDLPADRPRPATEEFNGAHHGIGLPVELSTRLRALSRANGCTLFTLLLTSFQTLLYRLTGETDVIVGTPISGRQRSELENIVGFFLNTLALRADLGDNPKFDSLLSNNTTTVLEAFDHQDLPFEKLVEEIQPERSLSYAHVFQVLFTLEHFAEAQHSIGDLHLTAANFDYEVAKVDLQMVVNESPDGIYIGFQYKTCLFDADSMERMLQQFQTLLEGVVADAAQTVDQLPLLHASEQQRLLIDFNATSIEWPFQPVHQLVEQQAERSPDAIAITAGNQSLSYAQLNTRANRLARHLQANGVAPGTLTAVSAERSLDTPVAILAILKDGGGYIPVDPKYPRERIEYMLADQ